MNPFDQFAGELNAALPPSSSSSMQPPSDALVSSPFSRMPPQQQQLQLQQQPMMNSNGLTNYYGANPMSSMPPGGGGGGMIMTNTGGGPPSNALAPMNNGMAMSASSPFAAPPLDASVGPGALVPSLMPSNPYALPGGNMIGPPPPYQPQQQQQQQQQQFLTGPPQPPHMSQLTSRPTPGYGPAPAGGPAMNPFGAPGGYAPPPPQRAALAMDPFAPSPAASSAVVPSDPWSSLSAPAALPAPAVVAADPWGPPQQQQSQQSSALVPSNAVNDDPFGIFGAAPSASQPPLQQTQPPSSQQPHFHPSPPPQLQQQQQQPPPPAPSNDDPWSDLGFGSAPAPPPQPAPASEPFFLPDEGDLFDGGIGAAAARAQREAAATPHAEPDRPSPAVPSKHHAESRAKSDLPPGGEWYDAKIFTPTLGVMFFKPKELVDSLFLQTDKSTVEALRDRPVVAFIVEGSSARSAGVELGHVLLKVNGIDVKNPKEASRLIKEGPRPLPLLFYVPDTKVVVAEGEHMVKYNTKETSAPNSAKDWKPKYVVIGGIIAQPWMMNMYRSKSEYDIAVIETQARRPISVKVKQFSLQGARIQNDWQGPQMVKYKNKLHPWKYIVVLPVSRNPIKIASPNLSQLKPVHEGIRRVLNAQQSRSGGGGHSVQPIPRDAYRSSERRREDEHDGRGSGGGGYNGREGGF